MQWPFVSRKRFEAEQSEKKVQHGAARCLLSQQEDSNRTISDLKFQISEQESRERLLLSLRETTPENVIEAVFATAAGSDWLKVVIQILNGYREKTVNTACDPNYALKRDFYCGGVEALTQLRRDLLARVAKAAKAAHTGR